jgi:trans-o-hydroxybenzylidenepyruvate hydratase-aldolase
MLGAKDLNGLVAMMPAFATDKATALGEESTIDVGRLHAGVDRMVRDGADAITVTGSFGECHCLLIEEFETLVRETVAAVKRRVPVLCGVPSENAREAVRKIRIAKEAGVDAVLVAVPYYIPSTVENAVAFFRDVAEMFPALAVMIYHNPPLHRIALPVDAFSEIVKSPNIIGMKDSHRDPVQFMKLQAIVRGKMSVFVGQWQYFALAELGAAGCWSIDAWMGPAPLIALRNAVRRGDKRMAQQITLDIAAGRGGDMSLLWRETASKLAIANAGYVQPGPLRAPFQKVPPEVIEAQRKHAERWLTLCEKYRAEVGVPA